jgi:two-component system cell cycle response regulator
MNIAPDNAKPARILLIDDLDIDLQHLRKSITDAGMAVDICEARDGLEGLKAVLASPIDLVICDLVMPNMDGFKFLEMVIARPDLQDIPVIMLTAREDHKYKVAGLEHGACDYLIKPFDARELVARIKVQLKIKRQKDQLKQTNQLLTELTSKDHLTQVNNRRSMLEILERELERSQRKEYPLSLVMFDLDHFKQVNDRFGHQAGDAVLQVIADLAGSHLRGYDSVARYGGEEFVLILPDTDRDGAFLVAERLRAKIELLTFAGELAPLRVTVSLGVATYPNQGISTVDELLRAADTLLYQAKRDGRNRVAAD